MHEIIITITNLVTGMSMLLRSYFSYKIHFKLTIFKYKIVLLLIKIHIKNRNDKHEHHVKLKNAFNIRVFKDTSNIQTLNIKRKQIIYRTYFIKSLQQINSLKKEFINLL